MKHENLLIIGGRAQLQLDDGIRTSQQCSYILILVLCFALNCVKSSKLSKTRELNIHSILVHLLYLKTIFFYQSKISNG